MPAHHHKNVRREDVWTVRAVRLESRTRTSKRWWWRWRRWLWLRGRWRRRRWIVQVHHFQSFNHLERRHDVLQHVLGIRLGATAVRVVRKFCPPDTIGSRNVVARDSLVGQTRRPRDRRLEMSKTREVLRVRCPTVPECKLRRRTYDLVSATDASCLTRSLVP